MECWIFLMTPPLHYSITPEEFFACFAGNFQKEDFMKQQRPNFLFFLPDQHRSDWLGLNPELPLRTPNINRLAQTGLRFVNAFTPSPLCSPARACLATGRDYGRCGVVNNGQNTPLELPTYYQSLRDAGYRVAGVGKFDLHKPDLDWGLDGQNMIHEYGFTEGIDNEGKGDAIIAYRQQNRPKGPYMQYLLESGHIAEHLKMYSYQRKKFLCFSYTTPLPEDAYCDNWIAENGLGFLREFPKDQPWHLVVNFDGPHDPFDVTESMRKRWEDVIFPKAHDKAHDNDEPDQEEIMRRRQNYAAMIENIDRHVGRFIDVVKERGELENTIIVYSSDHGEMLGDHNRWAKSVWYNASAGIPLIMSGPGIQPGIASDALVSLHDLAATFIDYADVKELPEMDAMSLRPVLEGRRKRHREHIFSGLNDWRMVFDGRYKLIIQENQPPVLYDLDTDPLEDNTIAEHSQDIVERLRGLLHDLES